MPDYFCIYFLIWFLLTLKLHIIASAGIMPKSFFHPIKKPPLNRVVSGDPGGIRTHDPQLRRLLLYPTELLDQICSRKIKTNLFAGSYFFKNLTRLIKRVFRQLSAKTSCPETHLQLLSLNLQQT